MPTITTHTVNSLIEFMEKVTDSLAGSGNFSWFRGIGNATKHKLTPKLFRHPSSSTIDEFLLLERNMLDRFISRSIMFRRPHMEFRDDRELDILVVMQHFGIPTRMLDWSESPFVALYFALTSANLNSQKSPPQYDDPAAVWALHPESWNSGARGGKSTEKQVFSLDSRTLDFYKPQVRNNLNGSNLAMPVLAVYGPHNNERVVAQRGAFTLFGQDVSDMETQFSAGKDFDPKALVRILIPPDKISSLLDQLTAMGITDSTIFPDLAGIAKEITRQQGYPV